MSRAVRGALTVVGAVVAVIGAVFAGQGLGLIPGSFMTGDRTWLFIGLAMLLIGVVLILVGTNRRKVS
jgi:uncharacterized membrane protein